MMKSFEKIRSARKSRKITLYELSVATGIDAASLSRIERGKSGMKVQQLLTIAKALGVDASELLGGDAE